MKRTKVCQIITKLELGGAQKVALFTAANLDRTRFETVLLAGSGGILDPEARTSAGRARFLRFLVRPVNPLLDLLGFLELWFYLVIERPRVVHTHSSKAGILGRWAAFFARVPVIVHTFHGYGFNDFQRPMVRSFYVLAERLTAKITDKFVVVTSEDIAKGLTNGIGVPAQYTVIRAGIDVQSFATLAANKELKKKEFNIPAGNKVVTTVGPFKPQKNLSDFIAATAEVAARLPDCTFLVVGDGEQRPLLEKLVAEKNLGDRVIFAGWRRDIGEILAITNVFVMTSLWEGLPCSILEAMASGLPVVANAVDGVREIVADGRTGYLIEPRHPEATADRIIRLLNDPLLADQMGQSGRKSIDRQYDLRYMVHQKEELYTGLINKMH